MLNTKLRAIAEHFEIEGTIADIVALGEGFINDTYVIRTEGGAPNYILQRKNHKVFPDVAAMMDNIWRVTNHLKRKVAAEGGDPMREVLTVIPTTDGALCYREGDNFWAVSLYIDDSVTHSVANTVELAYMGGRGIGRFQALLADFDTDATPVRLEAGSFVVLFPQDAHSPACHVDGPVNVKKIIGKVRI
jgi:hypothetical protein